MYEIISLHRFLVRLQRVTCEFLALTVFAGFLSWFRNGLLATGIGVIAFVQSEVGREAGYGTGPNTPTGFSVTLKMNKDFCK